MKFCKPFLLIILMIIPLMFPLVFATSSESHHVPILYAGGTDYTKQPYVAGYMDTNGLAFGFVNKTRVTVSFPDTDPSVIQADNWLAGGIFVTGYDSKLHQIDYGFYTMLTLKHDGSLYLDFGINQTYECLWTPSGRPYGSSPWTKGIYNTTIPIEGASPSTPITLIASWDEPYPGWVSWEYTISGVTYLADAQNVRALVEALVPSSNIQPYFSVGSRNISLWINETPYINYWQTYLFQFGVTSLYNIGHGGWNVLLSNPSYFKDGGWHNVETARFIGGANALLDYRWMWGGENYEGVSAYCPSLEPRSVKFHYSGSTIGDNTVLWGIPVAPVPPDNVSIYVDPNSDLGTYAMAYVNEGTYQLVAGIVGTGRDSYANATLFRNFIPMRTVTNPTFTFVFHDRGFILAQVSQDSYATLNASLRLLYNEAELVKLSQPIHTVIGGCSYTNCFHTISMTYYGELLGGNTYTVEYGFSVFEHNAYIDFASYSDGTHEDWRTWAVLLVREDNYKLTVKTCTTAESEITGVDVWVDGSSVSPSPVTVITSWETHIVQVSSTFSRYRSYYTFSHWENSDPNNPRTLMVSENMTITAYYNVEYEGTCPTLFVWNGTNYTYETLLDIHAESDIALQYRITQPLIKDGAFYKLSLRELDNFTSHIDQVKLYAVDSHGELHICPLASAIHSEQGWVILQLRFDDNTRVDLAPTQTINLKFTYLRDDIAYFIFEINGYNKKWPG